VDEEIDALIDQQPLESESNFDIEVFADDGDEDSSEGRNEETASNADHRELFKIPIWEINGKFLHYWEIFGT